MLHVISTIVLFMISVGLKFGVGEICIGRS